MVVIPLVLAAIILGVAELAIRGISAAWAPDAVFTLVLSSISVIIGVTLANVIRPARAVGSSRAKLFR